MTQAGCSTGTQTWGPEEGAVQAWLTGILRELRNDMPEPSVGPDRGFPADIEEDFAPFAYEGNLSDMLLDVPSIPGCWPTASEITASGAYWYADDRLIAAGLLPAPLKITSDLPVSKRGTFRRTSDDARIFAFLGKWAWHVARSSVASAVFGEAARKVKFAVFRASGTTLDTFATIYQSYEDDTKRADENGNHVAFRRAERYLYLQALLRTEGKGFTNKDILAFFTSGKIQFANKETAISSVDSIQKLISMASGLVSKSRHAHKQPP